MNEGVGSFVFSFAYLLYIYLFSGQAWVEGKKGIQCISNVLRTTAYLRSTTPYHPHGAPIFPCRQTKGKQQIAELQIITQNTSENPVQEKRKRKRNPLLHPSPCQSSVVVISFSNLEDPEIGLWRIRVVTFAVVTGIVIRGVCLIEAEELCMPQAGCSQEQVQGK